MQTVTILNVSVALVPVLIALSLSYGHVWLSVTFWVVIMTVAFVHYGLQYDWAFIGRYFVSIGIPVVMAWAGNHLAAKGETDAERTRWRVLFGMLTAFALVGSFWVQSQQEKDHASELRGARKDSKSDMWETLVKYNNEHPRNQISPDQISEVMKNWDSKRSNETLSMGTAKQRSPDSEWVKEEGPGIVAEMKLWAQKWSIEDQSMQRDMETAEGELKLPPTAENIDRVKGPFLEKRQELARRYTREVQPLIESAQYLQTRLLNRVTGRVKTKEDKFASVIFAKVAAQDPIGWSDMGMIANYMDQLLKNNLPSD